MYRHEYMHRTAVASTGEYLAGHQHRHDRLAAASSDAAAAEIRPTQSVMYVPLQVNRFHKRILLIVQYKYLKSCFADFYSPESDPPHKIMHYWSYYSI